jgi:predicted Zn-dependent peptidase
MKTTSPMDPSTTILNLPNGIRVIHKSCVGLVSCCGFVLQVGSRDELDFESGLAHFTEHMLFKGTTNRRPHHILNRMETVGGELNAYTTKEELYVYSMFLEKDYERAIELLTDLVHHSVFQTSEIEKERLVIMDEINSYEDSPSDLIFDDFEALLYGQHPIGRRILGSPDSLNAFDQQHFVDFLERNYDTERLVFYSQSSISTKHFNKLIDKYLSVLPRKKAMKSNSLLPNPHRGMIQTLHKDTHQAHVIIGGKNYALNDPKRVGMVLLSNILGGPGMNSRLNVSLREKRGLVYSVESGVSSYSDTGLFTIYLGTDPSNLDQCLTIVEKELRLLMDNKLTDRQLKSAQNQLFGQMAISSENKENATLAMGKSLLHFNKYDSMEEVMNHVLTFKALDLMDIANEILEIKKLNRIIYD